MSKLANLAVVTCCCPCVAALVPFICPREYERAVVFRLGELRSGGAKGPGVSFFNPYLDEYVKVDMRIETFDIRPQEVLTSDAVLIYVDAVVHFRVEDAVSSCCDVADYRMATGLMCEGTLRTVLGKNTLSDILERKSSIMEEFETTLSEATCKWGVAVVGLALKNIMLPPDMRRTMSIEAESRVMARAEVELARGEEQAAGRLAKASQCLTSPAAVTLRSLEELCSIASTKPSLTLFPFPFPKGYWNW